MFVSDYRPFHGHRQIQLAVADRQPRLGWPDWPPPGLPSALRLAGAPARRARPAGWARRPAPPPGPPRGGPLGPPLAPWGGGWGGGSFLVLNGCLGRKKGGPPRPQKPSASTIPDFI